MRKTDYIIVYTILALSLLWGILQLLLKPFFTSSIILVWHFLNFT